MPRVTTELFAIPIADDRTLVYAPLKRAAFVGNDAAVRLIRSLLSGGDVPPAESEVLHLLRRLDVLDGTMGEPEDETPTGAPAPTSVTLFLTTVCNLRCSYCYASAGDTPSEFMDLSTARRGIEYVVTNAARLGESRVEVAYHGGGEPTANWSVLTDSWEHAARAAERHGLELRALTATNGAIAPTRADWIVDHLNGASVSFDGLPHVQDLHRPTVSGRGSSARLEETLVRFDRAEFDYQLRLTVTETLLPLLPHAVQYLCDNFGARRIQIEPVYSEGRAAGGPGIDPDRFVELFAQADEIGRAHGRLVYYSAARAGMVTRHFCGVTRDSFALTPSGHVSACYEAFSDRHELASEFFYGRLASDGSVAFDGDALERLRGRTVDRRPYCQGCFAKWSCAGDCHVKQLEHDGRPAHEVPPRCRITRELTKRQILSKIEQGGGLFWHEPSTITA